MERNGTRARVRAVGWALLCLMIFGLAGAPSAVAKDDNENSTPTGWWFYTGQTSSQVSSTITKYNARITSIRADVATNTYTVTYVKNTGTYAKSWWWYVGIDAAAVSQNLATNNGRLISLQAYDTGGGNIRFAVVMVANTGADAKGWWWYYGQTAANITTNTTANNARLTNLDSYVVNGVTRYAVVMISNTGADAKSWWWYHGVSPTTISTNLTANNARLLDFTSASTGTFNVVMESCSTGCPGWWWYYGVNAYGVLDKAQNTGARVMSADPYSGSFAALMINNVPSDITSCDPNGCISQSKLATGIKNSLSGKVVGYSLQVGGLAPKYGGLARTATDTSLSMRPDLVINLASVSKTLTMIGILQLLDKGGLTVDTKISPYLYTDWSKGANISRLTFRHLLTHTSGLAQSASNCMTNGTGPTSGISYAGLQTIVANGVPNATNIGVPKYGNCNFALLRELMPALSGTPLMNYPNGSQRAQQSSALYVNYMNIHVFQPVGVPTSQCKPPAGTSTVLSYPYPAGNTAGTDWGDWSLTCGGGGWVLSADQLFRVINDLAAGSTLLTKAERTEMISGDLGWDSAVRNDCPTGYVCKNGSLGDGTHELWTYSGILKCNVAVVLVVNSPLPSIYENGADIIGLVKDAFNASTVAGTPVACR